MKYIYLHGLGQTADSWNQIPGAGHEVNQEAPAKLSAALQAFYKGIG